MKNILLFFTFLLFFHGCTITYNISCENKCKKDENNCKLFSSLFLFPNNSSSNYTQQELYDSSNNTFTNAEYINPVSIGGSLTFSATTSAANIDIFYIILNPKDIYNANKINFSLLSGNPTCALYSTSSKSNLNTSTPDSTLTFLGNLNSSGIQVNPVNHTYYYVKCTDTISESYQIKLTSNNYTPPVNSLGLFMLASCPGKYSSCIDSCRSGGTGKNDKNK